MNYAGVVCTDKIYEFIGIALTSSSNFFINYVVFQARAHATLQLNSCALHWIRNEHSTGCDFAAESVGWPAVQGFLMVPYRIMLPTLFPLFIMLRKLRILPCAPTALSPFHGLQLAPTLLSRG